MTWKYVATVRFCKCHIYTYYYRNITLDEQLHTHKHTHTPSAPATPFLTKHEGQAVAADWGRESRLAEGFITTTCLPGSMAPHSQPNCY